MLVRIPSDYLRQKNLEKSVWYVGESMFHAVQWSSSVSSTPPSLESIQIWAHLTGIPLDLRHEEGLSLVAGLVGEPKETDDFTKNMVSLTLSHVKVAVDLTKPLPKVVEFIRQSGEVVEVQVSYPWVPATCSHCKELGHVSRNCILLPPPSKSSDVPQIMRVMMMVGLLSSGKTLSLSVCFSNPGKRLLVKYKSLAAPHLFILLSMHLMKEMSVMICGLSFSI